MATINNNFKDPGIHKIPPRIGKGPSKNPSRTKTMDTAKTMDSVGSMMKPAIRSTAGDNTSIHGDFSPVGLSTHAKIGK